MAPPKYAIKVKEVVNRTPHPVLFTYDDKSYIEVPDVRKKLDYVLPEGDHAFKILMVQGNVSYAFHISKSDDRLQVSERVTKTSQSLKVNRLVGSYNLIVENNGFGLVDTTKEKIASLLYGEVHARGYHFVINNSVLMVEYSDRLEAAT